MRKRIIITLMMLPFFMFSQSMNLVLMGTYEWPSLNSEGSDIWGWVDANGNEYALVGLNDGFSVVDVTSGTNPVEMFYIPGLNSTWRDIKTWNNYAYVTTEADAGLLIVDLNDMTGNTYWHKRTFTNPSSGSVQFTAAHNIYIDENGIAYIFGASDTASSPSNGAIFLDVNANPTDPIYLGEWDDEYIHDGMARGDTMYAGCIYAGELLVVDVSNKSNPQTLGSTPTPNLFTHNAWVSDNGDFVFTTDEQSDAYLAAYDITNINNIQEVDRIQSNPGSGTIPHNTHVDGNFLITSYYRDGTTVHDITYPNNMIEVAYYDSYTGSGSGFDGCWGTYPFLPSGNIISSEINSSSNQVAQLLIFERQFQQACYLDGTVTDANTSNAIASANVEILNTSITTSTNISGSYTSGIANSGTYNILFSKAGYESDTISSILSNGNTTTVNAQLIPLPSFAGNGMVTDINGNGIGNAQVLIYNNDFTFNLTTDQNGNFNIANMYDGNYEVIAGQWGYNTICTNENITTTNNSLTIVLPDGYYDDFTFDFGWSVTGGVTQSSDGLWERGNPEGTSRQGVQFNPDDDLSNDCYENAFVTGLSAGGSVGDNDVDDYNTILISPVFDLSSNQIHFINYYYWFNNDYPWGSSPNDTLTISLSNGTNTVVLQTLTSSSPNLGQWNFSSIEVAQYITPTANMQLIAETADWDALGGHWVEAAIDVFSITSTLQTTVEDLESEKSKLIKIVDVLGREAAPTQNTPLFYIYENGSVEKKVLIE
ncbi:MAG: choice-of-anchor B family protein [Bacteroidota bacterium]|nr:choice-of-anchor B family protein [Bacteroidota bacterium]